MPNSTSPRVRARRVEPKGRDEIARPGNAVDTMADALNARLEAERRVTADIAHELRTPVAGLVTAVGLLPPSRPADLVSGGVHRLRLLVEDLLEVARLDVPGVEQARREEVRLGELARRAAAATGKAVEVRVHRDEVVETDPRRVERILAGLITNAHRHGAPPVTLDVDGTSVHVRNEGPGFPHALLTEGQYAPHGSARAGHGRRPGTDDRHGPGPGPRRSSEVREPTGGRRPGNPGPRTHLTRAGATPPPAAHPPAT